MGKSPDLKHQMLSLMKANIITVFGDSNSISYVKHRYSAKDA